MEQITPKYNFRRRDYARIKNWYDFTKIHFVPHPPNEQIKNQKQNEWHYRIIFDTLELTQHFVNNNMKNLFQLRQLVFMNSLYHRQSDSIISSGKQITVACQFDITNLSIKCSQQLTFYFYLTAPSPKDYEFCLEIQMVNNEGQILRFGFTRLALMLRKDTPKRSIFLVFNSKQMDKKLMEEIQNISQVRANKKQETECSDTYVAKVQFELDIEQIKQMKRYLPSYKIINKNSKLPPTNFNLKKKKEQITVDASYKITLQDLMIEINNPEQLRLQLLQSNPFTYSHKELIKLKIKEYRVIVDHHNGWKSLQNNKLQPVLELVVQKGDKIYVSTKRLPKVQISYYESDYIILFAALVCRVEFKLEGMVEESREEDFLIGWLPLPLDLSLRQNKIELMMVNDLQFPLKINHIANVSITIAITLLHPNFQKYKAKNDDKKMFRQNILEQTNIVNSTKYTKLRSRKNNTETLSSESNINQPLDTYLQHASQIIHQSELQIRKNSYVNVTGRFDSTQTFPTYISTLPIQQTVGKVLKVRLQIDTFIPVSDSPFDYYLPKDMQGSIYFLRQKHEFRVSIAEREGRFNIPIQISNQKIKIYFKRFIDNVEQFETIMNSRFVITLYEQNSYRLYAKGIATTQNILGATEVDQIAYVTLKRWEDGYEKLCGKLLVSVNVEVQKLRESNNKVQELQVQNVMRKLTTEQRMRLRIGNFKGDNESKNETISLIKKKQQKEYIQKVVASEQKCDGEMYYQQGSLSYYLVKFSNDHKSQNNVFTFHLACSYADIVTNQQQFRSIIQQHNFDSANFQRMSFYLKEPNYQSYYQTKLNYNQQIGILIKLNVYEQSQKEEPLSRLELLIKRNTIEAKKIVIKCRYKQPLFGDIFYETAIQHHSEDKDSTEVMVDLDDEMIEKYMDFEVMTKQAKYAGKQKKLIINKVSKSTKIVLLCQDKVENRRVFLLYHILLLNGKKLKMLAGKPQKLSMELSAVEQAQIIRCNDLSVKLLKSLKLHGEYQNQLEDMQIKILKPVRNKNIIAVLYDLSGKQLSQYLFKIESTIQFVSNTSEIIIDDISIFAITFFNPYACASYFYIQCSTKAVTLEQTELRLDSYAQKLVQFKVRRTHQKHIYFYLLDKRNNICQIEELICRLLPSNSKEYQPFIK